MKIMFFCLALTALVGCRMPGEDDYSTIPATNNPSITREKPTGLMPNVTY